MYYDKAVAQCGKKRPRSCDEENCELMPISKRISNLHIRSCFPDPPLLADVPEMQTRTRDAPELNRQVESKSRPSSYRPELTLVQNPYYYHANAVLYEAHLHRLQRLAKMEA